MLTARQSQKSQRPSRLRHDALDDYRVSDDSDPFASPSPTSRKRKDHPSSTNLGIDEAVTVAKRVRAPTVKLDEHRLLSKAGIPELRARARNLRFKGKSHEFSDAERLLSYYQLWLDDLFPKARFADALRMVEKAGHKKALMAARKAWLEGKPRPSVEEVEENGTAEDTSMSGNAQQQTQSGHEASHSAPDANPKFSPENDDYPNDEDLYDATPPTRPKEADETDDLDALINEAESHDRARIRRNRDHAAQGALGEDDLDAFIAEAEAQDKGRTLNEEKQPQHTAAEDDLDALIAEAEARDHEGGA